MLDLIIKDEEFSSFENDLKNIDTKIEEELNSLISILTYTCAVVVTEGDFHTNLKAFTNKLSDLKGELGYVTSLEENISSEFISDVDALDSSLY